MKNDFIPLERFVVRRPAFNYDNNGHVNVRNAAGNMAFQEALFFASPDLHDEFRKYIHGELSAKETHKMELTLTKYLLRMTYRCTPFGAFSACGMGQFGTTTRIASAANARRHFRYDYAVIFELVQHILSHADAEVFSRLLFKSNGTERREGRLYRLCVRNKVGKVESCKIAATPLLNKMLRICANHQPYSEIKSQLQTEFEISDSQLLGYVRDLTCRHILLTDINVEVIGYDNLENIVSHLSGLESTLSIANTAEEMLRLINEINHCDSYRERYRLIMEAEALCREAGLNINRKQFIQVDTYIDNITEISSSVRQQVARGLELMKRLSLSDGTPLNDFITRFYNRYEGRCVPLTEALDPITGIGYASRHTSLHPLLDSLRPHARKAVGHNRILSVNLTPFEQILLRKLSAAGNLNAHEVVITDSDLPVSMDSGTTHYPPTMACMYKIAGFNEDGPIIYGLQFTGTSSANMLTRFADGHDGIKEIVSAISQHEHSQAEAENKIIAEISHLTEPHYGNVQCRPDMREYAITYMSFPRTGNHKEIALSDLYLKIQNNKLILWSKSLDKEVLPRLTSAFNYRYKASDIYRFLGEMQHAYDVNSLFCQTSGLLSLLAHSPRVSYGNVILSPESWTVNLAEMTSKGLIDFEKFNSECDRREMPRYITYANGDNVIVIDRQSPIELEILSGAAKGMSTIMIEEFPPMDSSMHHYDSTIEIIHPYIVSKS